MSSYYNKGNLFSGEYTPFNKKIYLEVAKFGKEIELDNIRIYIEVEKRKDKVREKLKRNLENKLK
jgi:hypothetical protein|tara:strand:+ start:389 stop:583 length:195 start_codon:yes stop_codon:yes gene_type:complete